MAVFYKKVLSDGNTLIKHLPSQIYTGWNREYTKSTDPYLADGWELIDENEFIKFESLIVAENFKNKVIEELNEGEKLTQELYERRLRLSGSKISPSGVQYSNIVKNIYPYAYFNEKKYIVKVEVVSEETNETNEAEKTELLKDEEKEQPKKRGRWGK